MKRYKLTAEQRAALVAALVGHALQTQPSLNELLLSGFRGFLNLADQELVESSLECGLDLPEGICVQDGGEPPTNFRVTWTIDIEEAIDAREAAERARAHQHPATSAVVFECTDTSTGVTVDVDLFEGQDQAVIAGLIAPPTEAPGIRLH